VECARLLPSGQTAAVPRDGDSAEVGEAALLAVDFTYKYAATALVHYIAYAPLPCQAETPPISSHKTRLQRGRSSNERRT
jgi:hypothetical protein